MTITTQGTSFVTDGQLPWNESYLKINSSTTSIAPTLTYAHRGNNDTPTIVVAGDEIYNNLVTVYDGTGYITSCGIVALSESVAVNNTPGRLILLSVPNNNFSTAKSIQLNNVGVGVNLALASAITADLDIGGVMRLRPLTAAPASPVVGMIAVADNSSWDPITRAGTVPYPVFYNGTAWVALSAA
jgi:hypothetical protein